MRGLADIPDRRLTVDASPPCFLRPRGTDAFLYYLLGTYIWNNIWKFASLIANFILTSLNVGLWYYKQYLAAAVVGILSSPSQCISDLYTFIQDFLSGNSAGAANELLSFCDDVFGAFLGSLDWIDYLEVGSLSVFFYSADTLTGGILSYVSLFAGTGTFGYDMYQFLNNAWSSWLAQ